ncbi:MAG TPA: hypothetical protein VKV57_08095 [bacterium]|nr:hypothetical protein [bacterium]
MFIALTAVIFVVDLALFALVFVIIRSRRASARVIAVIVALAALLYLASLALQLYVSARFT